MTTKQLKDKIEQIVKDVQKKLRLEQYDIIIKFKNNKDDSDITADIFADPKYLNATITFYTDILMDQYKKLGLLDLRATVLHEMSHLILWDLRVMAQSRYVTEVDMEYFDEKATEHLAILFNEFIYGNKKKTYRVR